MHIKDYARAEGWFRKHAAAPSSIGSWKAFVARNKRAQEPRTMAQGGGMMGQLVAPSVDGSRPGYSGEFGPNIRKLTKSDSFEVQVVRGGTTGGKGGQKFYETFSFGEGTGTGPKPKYKTEDEALKAAKKYRDSVKDIKKTTGKQSKGQPIGFKKQTGGQAAIRTALNDIIEVGGKSFSNEDIRKLIDMDLFPDDDQFRKAVDVVKKENEFKNLTFEKKPRPRLSDDPVSVLQAATHKRRQKKLDILGSKEYEKELYQYKKEVQEGLGLKKYKTSGSMSGKPRELFPIEMGHQSSIKQLSLLKQKLRPEDLGPQHHDVNRKGIRKYKGGVQTLENNLDKKFYPEQKKLYNQAKKFIDAGKEVPADLQNKIINSNERIQIFIDDTVKRYPLLKDRVKAITIDAGNLTVKRGGNVLTELGIGLVDQDLGNIKIGSIDDLTIKANLAEQTLREAVDAGLIDEKVGRKNLTTFMGNTKVKDFSKTFSKTFQDLSPRSVAQLSKEFDCGGKVKGGSIMSCLKTNFNKAPEKFLQRAAPLAKDNVNLYKWFKNGRRIARGTGIVLAWEAAFAPIIVGWGKLEGDSNQRIIHDLAYGSILEGVGVPPEYVPGKSEKEEWMEDAGGDELAYKMKRMGELENQELPQLEYERDVAINKTANVPKLPGREGKGYQQLLIERAIKEKELELQALYNTPEFYEGPAGGQSPEGDYGYNEPVIQDAYALEQLTTAKRAAEKAERKKAAFDWLREKKIIANKNWQSQMATGGIADLIKKK